MRSIKKLSLLAVCTIIALPGISGAGTAAKAASSSAPSYSIALSNSYAGNSWRQQMISTFQVAGKSAQQQGLVAKWGIVNSDNSASQQISQIQNMILQHWSAITIDAASPTALNGVIAKACAAGIKVIVFDSLATAPCAYEVAYDYVAMGADEANYAASRLGGKGNFLEIRGVAGTSVDNDIHTGIVQALSKYPGIKIVGSVHGNWTETVAQQAVQGILPSLPKVDAVVDQGGDGYGAAQAFKALKLPMPLIIEGNRESELQWWSAQAKSNGYATISVASTPGVASVAFWVAYEVLQGASVPKVVNIPYLKITKADLATWIQATSADGVATPQYSLAWTKKLIDANAKHLPLPAVPLPGQAS
jgi:ribose transport system substrate-binding protein